MWFGTAMFWRTNGWHSQRWAPAETRNAPHPRSGLVDLCAPAYCRKTVLTQRTDQTVEGHGGDMADHCAPLQAEATMGDHQGIASHLGSHLAIAQDEMWQHGEHGFAPHTLETPDADPTQADTDIMGVTWQTPAAATGRPV